MRVMAAGEEREIWGFAAELRTALNFTYLLLLHFIALIQTQHGLSKLLKKPTT